MRIIRRLIEKLGKLFTDLSYILSPEYRIPHRGKLFRTYLKIAFKNSLCRWFTFKKESFLGYTVTLTNYPLFFEIFRQIFVRHSYYFESEKNNPNILDCGGNMGMFTLYAKYLYPDAVITVFEPSPNILPLLKENIEINKLENITLVESGVSGETGEIELFSRGIGACGDTLEEGLLRGAKVPEGSSTHTIKIDKLSNHIDQEIDFLKLDVEGSEGLVIDDLDKSKCLEKIQSIAMEYHYYPEVKSNDLDVILNTLKNNNHGAQPFLEQTWPEIGLGIIRENSYYCLIRTHRKI